MPLSPYIINKEEYFQRWRKDSGNRVSYEDQEKLVNAVNALITGDPDGGGGGGDTFGDLAFLNLQAPFFDDAGNLGINLNADNYESWSFSDGVTLEPDPITSGAVLTLKGGDSLSMVREAPNTYRLDFTGTTTNNYLDTIEWDADALAQPSPDLIFSRIGLPPINFSIWSQISTYLSSTYALVGELGSMAYNSENNYYTKAEADLAFDNYQQWRFHNGTIDPIDNILSDLALTIKGGTDIDLIREQALVYRIDFTGTTTNNFLNGIEWDPDALAQPSPDLIFSISGLPAINFSIWSQISTYLSSTHGLVGELGSMAYNSENNYYTKAEADLAFDNYNQWRFHNGVIEGPIDAVSSDLALTLKGGTDIDVIREQALVYRLDFTGTTTNNFLNGIEWDSDAGAQPSPNLIFSRAGLSPINFSIWSQVATYLSSTHGLVGSLGSMAYNSENNYYTKAEADAAFDNYSQWRFHNGTADPIDPILSDLALTLKGGTDIDVIREQALVYRLDFTGTTTNNYLDTIEWDADALAQPSPDLIFSRIGLPPINFSIWSQVATYLSTTYALVGELGSMAYNSENNYYTKAEADAAFDNYNQWRFHNGVIEGPIDAVSSDLALTIKGGTDIDVIREQALVYRLDFTGTTTNNFLNGIEWDSDAGAQPSPDLIFSRSGLTAINFSIWAQVATYLSSTHGLVGSLGSMAYNSENNYYTKAEADLAFDNYQRWRFHNGTADPIDNVLEDLALTLKGGTDIDVIREQALVYRLDFTGTTTNNFLNGIEWDPDAGAQPSPNLIFSRAGLSPINFSIWSQVATYLSSTYALVGELGSMAYNSENNYYTKGEADLAFDNYNQWRFSNGVFATPDVISSDFMFTLKGGTNIDMIRESANIYRVDFNGTISGNDFLTGVEWSLPADPTSGVINFIVSGQTNPTFELFGKLDLRYLQDSDVGTMAYESAGTGGTQFRNNTQNDDRFYTKSLADTTFDNYFQWRFHDGKMDGGNPVIIDEIREDFLFTLKGGNDIDVFREGQNIYRIDFEGATSGNDFLTSVEWSLPLDPTSGVINFIVSGQTNPTFELYGKLDLRYANITHDQPFTSITGSITDAQHGNRGGGSLHAVATTSVAGFMSGADKTKLNGISAGADNYNGWGLQEGSNASINVGSGQAVSFIGGTGITVSRSTRTITITNSSLNTDRYVTDLQFGGTQGTDIILEAVRSGGLSTLSLPMNAHMKAYFDTVYPAIGHGHAFTEITGTITNTQHGNRGGGSLHSIVSTTVDGFMSWEDKVKLNNVALNADNYQQWRFSNGVFATPDVISEDFLFTLKGGTDIKIEREGVNIYRVDFDGTISGNDFLTGVEWNLPLDPSNGVINFIVSGQTNPTFNPFGKLDLRYANITHTHPFTSITGTVPVNQGGTGRTTLTNDTVLVGNGTTAISMLSRSGIDSRTLFPTNLANVSDSGTLAGLSSINNSNWSGTDLSVANGGTGVSTHTSGQVLIGAGTSAITTLSRSGIDSRTSFPPEAHTHHATEIDSGVLLGIRGGTGIGAVTVGNFLQGGASNTWNQITPTALKTAIDVEQDINTSITGVTLIDSTLPYGKMVIILCPESKSGNHNVMGRIISQRSSGNRDGQIVDFAYSSASSGTSPSDYYIEYAQGEQGLRNEWKFAKFDYDGTTWVGIYYDGFQYSLSTMYFRGKSLYTGVRFLDAISTSAVTNLSVLDQPSRKTFTRDVYGERFFGVFDGNGSNITFLNANNVSSGTLAVTHGGTGLGTLPASGQVLRSNGTAYVATTSTISGIQLGNNLDTLLAGTGLSFTGGGNYIGSVSKTLNIDNPFDPAGTYSQLRAQNTTKVDVGLGSVMNYGISDSYNLNSSTSYASSKAVRDHHALVDNPHLVSYSNIQGTIPFVPASGGTFTGDVLIQRNTSASLNLEDTRTGNAYVSLIAGGRGIIGTNTNHSFNIKTNSIERLYVHSGGNVGIGTSSPDERLEVSGFARTSSGYKVGVETVINSSRNASFVGGTFTGQLIVNRTAGLGHLRLLGSAAAGNNAADWRIGFISSGDDSEFGIRDGVSTGTPFPFRIRMNTSSNALVIDSGGVGFGRDSATELIHSNAFIRAESGYKVGATTVIDSSRNFFGVDGTFTGTVEATGGLILPNTWA